MSYELEGVLYKVFPTETKSANLDTRDFVVMVPGQYPEYVKFQLKNMKCSLADGLREGSTIKVTFDITGREWQDKYFVNLVAWKIDVLTSETKEPLKEVKIVNNDIVQDAEVVDPPGEKPIPF